MKSSITKAELLRSTIIAGLSFSLFAGTPAFAQDAEPLSDVPVEQVADKKEEKTQDVVVVTGSRIRRNEFSSPVPIQVINTDQSALAGLLTTAEILQTSPIAAGQQIDDSFSGFVTDGGAGANTLSLRGLGAQRTLILVNGKRWVPSGTRGSTNSVDLTALPSSIYGRIEILKDGASSVYGADAVAGVVNVITKDNLEGFQVNLSARSFLESSNKLGYNVDASYGVVKDNWSASISGDYSHQDQVTRADAPAYAKFDNRIRFTDQDGDGTIDFTDPVTGELLPFGFIYGLATSPFGFIRFEEGAVGPFGIANFTLDPETPLDNSGPYYRDSRSADVAQLVSERDSYSLTSFGQYDFDLEGRDATAYYEAYFNRRESVTNGGFRQYFPTVGPQNPTNPFGLNGPLVAFGGRSARPVLPSYGVVDPAAYTDINRYNMFAGLKGDINEKWSYDTYIGVGGSNGTYQKEQVLSDRLNFLLGNDLVTGNPNGALPCTPLPGQTVSPDLVNGCPATLNLFSGEVLLNGNIGAAARDYLTKNTVGNTKYTGVTFSAIVSGELFEAPAGTVQGVFGVEVRNETIDDRPDPDARRANIEGSSAAGITAGSDNVKEFFTEVEIPLVNGKPFFESLTANVAARYTDYASYGGGTTYRLAGNWEITPEYRVRASFGTSYRAPDLFEQFLGRETGFSSGFADPCLNFGNGANPGLPGEVLYDNCIALGLDPVTFGNAGVPSIQTVTGGNPDLLSENSDSLTIGFIYQPDWIGMSFGVDYFDIEVRNTVARPSVGFILGDCLVRTSQTSAFCSRIGARDANGNLTTVDSSLLNVGAQGTKGYDFNVKYDQEFSFGDLNINGQLTYVESQTLDLLGTFFEYKGDYGNPELSGNVQTNFDWKDYRFTWTMNYIGATEDPTPGRDPAPAGSAPGTLGPIDRPFQTEPIVYHSLGIRYRANDWDVIASVRNVFNELPPLVTDSTDGATSVFNTIPGSGYDLLGRSVSINLSRKF